MVGILVVDGFQTRVVLGVGDVNIGGVVFRIGYSAVGFQARVESDEKKKRGFIL